MKKVFWMGNATTIPITINNTMGDWQTFMVEYKGTGYYPGGTRAWCWDTVPECKEQIPLADKHYWHTRPGKGAWPMYGILISREKEWELMQMKEGSPLPKHPTTGKVLSEKEALELLELPKSMTDADPRINHGIKPTIRARLVFAVCFYQIMEGEIHGWWIWLPQAFNLPGLVEGFEANVHPHGWGWVGHDWPPAEWQATQMALQGQGADGDDQEEDPEAPPTPDPMEEEDWEPVAETNAEDLTQGIDGMNLDDD